MHTEIWATSRGVSLRMRAYDGDVGAPAVVAFHGLGTGVDVLADARDDLDPYAYLRDQGCHVLALDWPGHGRSGGRRGHLTYRMASDAAATASEVARGRWDAPVAVFGTGIGGVLAFYAALEDPRLVAVASAGLADLREIGVVLGRTRRALAVPAASAATRLPGARLADRVMVPTGLLVSRREMAEDPELARALWTHPQSVRRYSLASIASILGTPEDKPDVRAQTTPVFAAVGSRDTLLPETATRAIVQRLSCPAQLWVLQGAGHQLLLEHPTALLPAVARFVHERAVSGRATG